MPRQTRISDRQLKFALAVAAGKSGPQAAREAGYPEGRASDLMRNPFVVSELDKQRAALREKVGYDTDQALKELEEAAAFAIKTNNATALARIRELKMKLMGLLKENKVATAGFQLIINGIDKPTSGATDV
ncbi:terminase small subunit [Burkholderia sp. AU31624]|uniref:terminase small subunit n=1 Tax=Burkholderia sp. AU31624 TaxID=2879629 RepID=UPI001CF54185|nr:terminase small subunit [Burkholderia sp. AU31624]MCA8254816.1 terminase small subunit [Burkholderia sp. AU31624]